MPASLYLSLFTRNVLSTHPECIELHSHSFTAAQSGQNLTSPWNSESLQPKNWQLGQSYTLELYLLSQPDPGGVGSKY